MRKINAFIELSASCMMNHAMMTPGERVLAAVSGGADSVALLLVLQHLEYPVVVAHLDHGTRNGESAADARFVARLAESLSLPCIIAHYPVEAEAMERGIAFEEHARAIRYDFLLKTAREQDCRVIATGHHADDVSETVLMRLLRGTSLRGLSGIPPVRDWEGLRIVRPFWMQSREDIRDWLRAQNQLWCEDYTNAELHPLRNRIRHVLLPQLAQDYNPQVRSALRRLSENLRRDNDYLEQMTVEAMDKVVQETRLNRAAFRALAPALQYRLLAQWCHDQGLNAVTTERLDTLVAALQHEGGSGMTLDLGEDLQLYIGRHEAHLMHPTGEAWEAPESTLPVTLKIPGEVTAFGHRFRCRILDKPPTWHYAAYCHAKRQLIDFERIHRFIQVRPWRPGDRFQPLGMSGRRKLSDYFQDRGIPAPQRKHELLLCGGETILWHVGGQISVEGACDPETGRFLLVEVDDGIDENAAD